MSTPYTFQDLLSRLAIGLIFLSLAAIGFLLIRRMGPLLPRRKFFLLVVSLFAATGAAQLLRFFAFTYYIAELANVARLFLFVALLTLCALVVLFFSQFSVLLKASSELVNRRGQERFYAVVQAAPVAVISTDCQGYINSWNPAAERIYGWTREEMLGTRRRTIPPERLAEESALVERVREGQFIIGFESERLRCDGTRFPVSISMAPLRDEEGVLTGIMAIIDDISERKRIARELNEKSSTLTAVTDALSTFLDSGDCAAASKHLLSRALQSTQSQFGFLGVVLEGPVLRILAYDGINWDAHVSRQLYDAKLAQYASQGFFELVHEQNLLGEVIAKGQTVVTNAPSADPRSGGLPPGHPRLRSFLGVPIFKGSSVVGVLAVANRPCGFTGEEVRSLEIMSHATGVLYDNYLQNLKRAKLEEQQSRLEREFRQAQKMEVLGRLSGGVAHDFNNMLMVLSGSTELLEHTLAPHSPASPYVDQIRRTIDKAAIITRQLLAFSRKQVLDTKCIDLHEVLTDCEFMLPRLLGSDIQLTFQHLAARSWILADASQLEQVLANLAINARDAMPAGGSLTISTRNTSSLPENGHNNGNGAAATDWLVLEVKDTGTGMDDETRTHIFEPFFTTKPLGKGTGLGLSTVYGIVRQFGGQIYLQSQLDLGTTFQIFFPVHLAAPAPHPAVSQSVRAAAPSPGLTILIADDETSLREAVAQYLRGAGHRVIESQNPGDALELARTHDSIDVLLTDVLMPGIRGTELARQVAEFHPGVHVIYMSGFAQNVPEAQIPAGAAFLQKPFRFASLAEQLKLVPR